MKCAKRKKDSLGPSSLSNNDNNASINSDQFGEEDDEDRKRKKVRTTFTGRQIFELEKMFEDKKYLSSTERAEMARMLNVTEQQVSCQVVAKTDSRNTLILFIFTNTIFEFILKIFRLRYGFKIVEPNGRNKKIFRMQKQLS